MINLRR